MKLQKENEFNNNYSVISITSSIIFSIYFIVGIFFLNLSYFPQALNSDGILGIFVIVCYYILTSIVLFPLLIFINTLLCLLIKKIVTKIYNGKIVLGFFLYPAIMTVIPFLMINCVVSYIGKVPSFDYYYIYINTWICAVFQYKWILNNIRMKPESINKKQSDFIKAIDHIHYF